MTLQEQARRLHEMADELNGMHNSFKLEPGLDLAEAMIALRTMLPKEFIGIEVKIESHPKSKPEVKWNVWDGKKFHEASTLCAALELVRINQANESGTVEDVQAACRSSIEREELPL